MRVFTMTPGQAEGQGCLGCSFRLFHWLGKQTSKRANRNKDKRQEERLKEGGWWISERGRGSKKREGRSGETFCDRGMRVKNDGVNTGLGRLEQQKKQEQHTFTLKARYAALLLEIS